MKRDPALPHVVIIGGGFAGIEAAKKLRRAQVEITLIDRRNHYLFQPLLYQVATGGLSPANISAPIRHVLRKQENATVLLGKVTDFDLEHKAVLLGDERIEFDRLIVACGVQSHYFGNDAWREHAPGLKSIEDATEIRRRVLNAFEQAERENDLEQIASWLTFVIVGGGPTGVELAGTLAEVASDTLRRDFRRIETQAARVVLVEGTQRVLNGFSEPLSTSGREALERLGVEVRTGWMVEDIRKGQVVIKRDDQSETIHSQTVVWAAGVTATPLAKKLAEAAGAETDRMGRIEVNGQLELPDHPEVLVLGDMAALLDEEGNPLPGVAPVAMQQGRYAGEKIRAALAGNGVDDFRYNDKGSMATIGRSAAVVDLGWTSLTGWIAWVAWLFIHLFFLIGFQNRALVLIQWVWNYLTFGRSARLITGRDDSEG